SVGDLSRRHHLHHGRAGAAGDLDGEPVAREGAVAARLEQPAELRLGLPVERDGERAAVVARAAGGRERGQDEDREALQDSPSETCQRRRSRRLAALTAANSASPSSDACRIAANTRSVRCWRIASSTTTPSPPPPTNSPTIAPITARPPATRSPVSSWGSAHGSSSFTSRASRPAP